MASEEVLKAVFPFLEGMDLVSCMLVCKAWRDLARDDYFWKCLCAKCCPSFCQRPPPPTMTYYKIYTSFYKPKKRKTLPPARLSFNDLDFYIDIWAENQLIFSEIVAGPVFKEGLKSPPDGVSAILRFHLGGTEYKMTLPVEVEPRFSIPLSQTVSVSVLVLRKDTNKVACIIKRACFDYIDRTAYRALAFEYLDFSPERPFISNIRAWISLLFVDNGNEGVIDVFGIQLDFCDVANSEQEVLWLLDMLDWKE